MSYDQADGMTQDAAQSQDTEAPDVDVKMLAANIAEELDEDQLVEIGDLCKKGFDADLRSRSDWEQDLDDWICLAKQIREPKSYPWQGASNVKYPLLATAAMQFSARSYPSLIPSNGKVVKSTVIGKDPTGAKFEKAERVSTYMSYQVMKELSGWDEDMDQMLIMLPIVGTIFKKTYYDKAEDKIVSRMVLPKNLVVNYWTKNLRECERISEIIEMSPRLLKERQRIEHFLDVDLGDPRGPENTNNNAPTNDETTPYELVEQHTFLDLEMNKDDFEKPYIVTFERNTGKVLRISARYSHGDMTMNEKGKIVKVKAIQMYTKFGFVPNPDGSFYDIGFGVLLGPLNESVNTLINLLIDSGHLSTLQSGFIGKGLRMKQGDSKFVPGEWKPVNATGDDLKKQIVPLPTKEPSNVLFELMGTLITSGKELASVAEIFVGKMPGQNTPATTTMATIEQGMKVFTAVYKRIFRSLSEEFEKIYDLNKMYLDPNKYIDVLDITVGPDDFDNSSYDICPGADPTAVSQTEKLMKAQGLMELVAMAPGALDPIKVISRVLEAQEQPNWQELFTQEVQMSGALKPQPDPKMMEMQMKMQAEQQKTQLKTQETQQKMELESRGQEQQMAMKQQEHAMDMQHSEEMNQLNAATEIHKQRIFMAAEQQKAQQDVAGGAQKLQQNQEMHQQKMKQTKESLSQKSKSTTGKGTK